MATPSVYSTFVLRATRGRQENLVPVQNTICSTAHWWWWWWWWVTSVSWRSSSCSFSSFPWKIPPY